MLVVQGGDAAEWQAAAARWPGAWRVPVQPCADGVAAVADGALEAVLGGSPLAVVVLDQGGVRFVSRAFRELVGARGDDDLQPAAWWRPGDADGRGRLRRADGEQLFVDARAWSVPLLQGDALALCLRPLSPGHEGVRHTTAWHKVLVENAHDAIAICDAEGRIVYQSPASLSVLGVPADEIVGGYIGLPDPDEAARVTAVFTEVLAHPGASRRVTYSVPHRDGSLRTIDSIFTNHLDDPAVGGIVVNSRDVSELRAAEQAMQQAEKVRLAGMVAATVAHDMKNMLSVVGGGLDVLEELVPVEARGGFSTMRAALQRSARLAMRLTRFGEARADEPTLFDLCGVLVGMRGMLRQLVGAGRRLELTLPDEPVWVRASAQEFEQAVVNLVCNARDAVGQGGRVAVWVKEEAGEAVVGVEDDGAGMSEEVRARVFEPWFSTKGPTSGSGLGMLVVEAFCRQAGGSVTVDSREGEGTRVLMRLKTRSAP